VLSILIFLGLRRVVGCLSEFTAALQLLFPPLAVLLDLVQKFLFVGEQIGDAGVLLQLAFPLRVLLGQLSRLALLRGGRLLDFVPQPDRRPLRFGL
jgi:hypothetical protein